MEFLKNNRRVSFLYGGKTIEEAGFKITRECKNDTVTTVYEHSDGFKVTNVARKINKFGAYEWVNYLENVSDKETKLITDLYDCDCTLPIEHEEPKKWEAYLPSENNITRVYAPKGSSWEYDEFSCDVEQYIGNEFTNHINTGEKKEYTSTTGRSSESLAPFFNVCKNSKGYIFAIGWTGKWKCNIERESDSIKIKTKIDDAAFKLYPREKVRTSSIVLLPYEASVEDSQNMWRRLVKDEFSLIGSEGRDKFGPLCANIWGGMKTSSILSRIEKIKKERFPFEYIWIDAGWYGENTSPSPDEFEGDWAVHTGDWVVSKKIHPNYMEDITKKIHDYGMKFLLWFEPERVIAGTPTAKKHPEYFLRNGDEIQLLLNLGDEKAWKYCFETLSGLIEKLNIDCYRQDFNFDPLEYWRENDSEDRRGMTEIKYINGLYRLWDALLEKFPNLIIDDCASGGRRIDIEMLRRSMPMWRSDAQCPADHLNYISQCHNLTFNTWMPYSGTGTGRVYDIYRVRSAYGASLATNYTYSEREDFADTNEKTEFIRRFTNEYLKVRPYFSEDFYPLTELSDKLDVWCASQFDRPSESDGMIQVFRREHSPYPKAVFELHKINVNETYTFTDIDTNESFEISGKILDENGFETELDKRSAKIFIYSHK